MSVTTESANSTGQLEIRARTSGAAPARSEGVAALIDTVRKTLGSKYRDIEPVGAGRSGFVFRARLVVAADAPEREEHIAIKVAYPGVSERSTAHQRFVREAMVGARLRHPHIAAVGPVQSSEGVTWFEMPLLGGFRLDRVLRNERQLTTPHAIAVLRDIAGALDYAATRGVAHGALRPSEVYILPDARVVLTGFLVDLDEPPGAGTAPRPSALGDPAYMAPEQWVDSPDAGPRADQYALAILAAELLGGLPRVVRHGGGMPEVLPLAIERDLPLRHGLGLHVNEALIRAMSRDPHLRFESSSLFVLALDDPSRMAHHTLPTYGTEVRLPVVHHWRFMLVMLALAVAVVLYFTR